jgi:hypothetical protein
VRFLPVVSGPGAQSPLLRHTNVAAQHGLLAAEGLQGRSLLCTPRVSKHCFWPQTADARQNDNNSSNMVDKADDAPAPDLARMLDVSPEAKGGGRGLFSDGVVG